MNNNLHIVENFNKEMETFKENLNFLKNFTNSVNQINKFINNIETKVLSDITQKFYSTNTRKVTS